MGVIDYRSRALYTALVVGLATSSFILIKTGRDAVFFQHNGLFQLPQVYIWIALGSMPAAMLHLHAISRWGARQTRTGLFFVSAFIFIGFTPFIDANQQAVITSFFILVPTLFAALFAGSWLLAGDLLEGADAATKRSAYSWIGATSMLGGIVGGLLAKGFSHFLEPRYLMAVGAFILVFVGLLVSHIHRRYPIAADPKGSQSPTPAVPHPSSALPGLLKDHLNLLAQPYIRVMVGISGLGALAGLYIDFQFYATVVISGKNNSQFFANFYIVLNAASLLLQLTVAPRLQARLGIGGALLLLPSVLLGGIGFGQFLGASQSRAILRVTEGGMKAAIHRSTWEQTFLPIDRAQRDIVKVMVDGLFARLAEGLGALVLLVWLAGSSVNPEGLDLGWISWAIVAALLLWIGLTRHLRALGCSAINTDEPSIRLPDSCVCVSALGQNK
jgi:ATP:ADP antiporter, AAA family